MAKKKPKHYCNNKDLLAELKQYKKTDIMSDELGVMFINISRRLTGHSYFRHYSSAEKDDLVGTALVRMVEQIDMFDVDREKANPFSYFTQIAWNCFVLTCRKHYKQKNIKRKIAIDCFTHMESNGNISIDPQLYDIVKNMITDDDHYEQQRKKRMNQKKQTEST